MIIKWNLKGLQSGLFTAPLLLKTNITVWQTTNTSHNKQTKRIHVTFVVEDLVDLQSGSVNVNNPNANMQQRNCGLDEG